MQLGVIKKFFDKKFFQHCQKKNILMSLQTFSFNDGEVIFFSSKKTSFYFFMIKLFCLPCTSINIWTSYSNFIYNIVTFVSFEEGQCLLFLKLVLPTIFV
jgi:hypothetical protein